MELDSVHHDVTVRRNLLIPLRDGVELAGDAYLPDHPGPHPVVVSYYPYHKDDIIGAAYEHANRYMARRGFATLVVDFRGLGSSAGVAMEAFHESEAEDAYDVVEWAAAQEWCNGKVGMWGLSYGGITSLRTAAARPPHLRAVIPMMCTLDLYHHWFYLGGCPNMLGVYGVWGPMMLAMQLMPPMYHDDGGRWRQVWQSRLEETRPYLLDWPGEGARDEQWSAKAIRAGDIEVPTFLIGGWRDIFPEGVINAFRQIKAPKHLLMGPWLHTQPDVSPFDAIEYLPMMTAWWRRWLAGEEGEAATAEALVFVQGWGWRREPEWPIRGTRTKLFHPDADGILGAEPASEPTTRSHSTDPTVGTSAGLWDPLGLGVGLPLEQSADEARSLSFTSGPLREPMEISGTPEATVLASIESGGEAHLVAKLSDIAPDGTSRLITTGWLRASHREGHAVARSIRAGEMLEFRLRLWATSYHLPAGHRIRLSLGGADFPRIWPTEQNPTLSVSVGGEDATRLALPIVPPSAVPPVALASPDPEVDRAPLNRDARPRWTVAREPATGTVTVETGVYSSLVTPEGDGRLELDHRCRARVACDRPQDAAVTAETRVVLHPPDGSEVVVETSSRATFGTLVMHGAVSVDGVPLFSRDWSG